MLALVTGFAAMFLYYYGLRSTPAVAATLAELAFPVTAVLVGYFKFGQALSGWQWFGVALTSTVVALLPRVHRTSQRSVALRCRVKPTVRPAASLRGGCATPTMCTQRVWRLVSAIRGVRH